MNKSTCLALLTGKRPRPSLKGVRGGPHVVDVDWDGEPLKCQLKPRTVKWNKDQTDYLLARLNCSDQQTLMPDNLLRKT